MLALQDATRIVGPTWPDLIMGLVMWGFFLALLIGLGTVVTRDMNARGLQGWAWGLLVMLLPPLGLFLWLLVRANSPRLQRGQRAG